MERQGQGEALLRVPCLGGNMPSGGGGGGSSQGGA